MVLGDKLKKSQTFKEKKKKRLNMCVMTQTFASTIWLVFILDLFIVVD